MTLSSTSSPHLAPVSVRLVQSMEELVPLAGQWDDLLAESSSNSLFQSWRFLSTWWKHFGAESQMTVLIAEDDQEVVGIAPLQIRHGLAGARQHLRHLCFLGCLAEADGLLFDFPIRKGRESQVMEAFFAASSPLFQLPWDLLYLPFVPAHSPCVSALRSASGPLQNHLVEVEEEESPFIEFSPTWDEFLLGRSSKFRRNLRASLRAMEEKLEAEEVSAVCQNSLAKLHDLLGKFNAQRWKDSDQEAHSAHFLAFERDLMKRYLYAGELEFHGWRTSSDTIALNCAFAHNHCLWGYQMAWNPSFAKFSPGNVAMASVVQHGIERRYQGLHMLLGASSYKKSWSSSSLPLCRLEAVRPGSLRGNLFQGMKQARTGLGNLQSRWKHEVPLPK